VHYFVTHLYERTGLLCKPTHGNIIRFAPPLCINDAEVRSLTAIYHHLHHFRHPHEFSKSVETTVSPSSMSTFISGHTLTLLSLLSLPHLSDGRSTRHFESSPYPQVNIPNHIQNSPPSSKDCYGMPENCRGKRKGNQHRH
jgi:hypothetical protein